MNTPRLWIAALAATCAAACGGSSKKTPAAPAAPRVVEPAPEDPEPDPPKVEPKQWRAKAALTPSKGAKLKPTLVSFSQREGEDTTIGADGIDGLKPGTYWLVIHDGNVCGPNATKAGPAWAGATPMKLVIEKDLTASLEQDSAPFSLAGDAGAIGLVLVVRDTIKGKPGKALACGMIEEVDD